MQEEKIVNGVLSNYVIPDTLIYIYIYFNVSRPALSLLLVYRAGGITKRITAQLCIIMKVRYSQNVATKV